MSNVPPEINPEVVKATARKLSNVFYDKQIPTQDRLKIIERLQKAGSRIENHIAINKTDAINLLSCMYNLNDTDDSLMRNLRETEVTQQENIVVLMQQHHQIRNCKAKSKRKLRECIKLLENDDTNIFQQMPCVELAQTMNFVKKQSTAMFETADTKNSIRKRKIWLGYALLNLSATEKDKIWVLLQNIVGSFNANLLLEETQFVSYLFKHENLPENLLQFLVNSFSFLYEKPILKLCVDLLKSENAQITMENAKSEQTLANVWNAACKNESLSTKIVNMLLNLYVLSGFNNSLLCVLNWYKLAGK